MSTHTLVPLRSPTGTMFLQPGLKEFNSRSRSISPLPSAVGKPCVHSPVIGHDASYMTYPAEGFGGQPDSSSSYTHPGASAGGRNTFGSWETSTVGV